VNTYWTKLYSWYQQYWLELAFDATCTLDSYNKSVLWFLQIRL